MNNLLIYTNYFNRSAACRWFVGDGRGTMWQGLRRSSGMVASCLLAPLVRVDCKIVSRFKSGGELTCFGGIKELVDRLYYWGLTTFIDEVTSLLIEHH